MAYAARNIAYSGAPSFLAHLGRNEYAFQKITVGDKLEGVEFLTHIGSQEQSARTRGIYKVDEITVTQLRAEWDAMMIHFPTNGFGNVIFPVTKSAVDPELPGNKDLLIGCSIVSQKEDVEATGKATLVEFKMTCRQIVWNGRTINVRRGAPNTPAAQPI